MIELQQAEDTAVGALQTLLRFAPESRNQLTRYISPSIQARLEYSNLLSVGSRSPEDPNRGEITSEGSHRLVPFVQGKKEARKPSYKIH